MRRWAVLAVTAGVAVVIGAAAAVSYVPAGGDGRAYFVEPDAPASQTATASAAASPAPTSAGPFLTTRPVTISSPGFWSWALLDTATGAITGSPNVAAPSDTASMSKSWVAADYLRRAGEKKQKPSAATMQQLSTMIRDSDTTHTFTFHKANGNLGSIRRMVSLCGLTETTGVQNSWSLTKMSARDVARLALCIADGRAAGPEYTPWLLGEMRAVRGPGKFGVIEIAPPAEQVAVKNGWLLRDDKQWHIACLAIGNGWTLGVMARHAGSLGKDHGAGICRKVAEQLRGQAG
jgi:hypothetical protein